MNRRMDALALLVSRGADLSLIDESGQTPLALARFLNHQDVIEVVEMEQGEGSCPVLSVLWQLRSLKGAGFLE